MEWATSDKAWGGGKTETGGFGQRQEERVLEECRGRRAVWKKYGRKSETQREVAK